MINKLGTIKLSKFDIYLVYQICNKDIERCVLPVILYANLNTPLLEEDRTNGICISIGWWKYALRLFIEISKVADEQ